MILHVTFSDGSNPWVCMDQERDIIAKHWRRWMKYHNSTAQPKAYHGGYICEIAGDRAGYWVYKQGEFWDTVKRYRHLGHALAALERLGGEQI